jgi:hypothetical protein
VSRVVEQAPTSRFSLLHEQMTQLDHASLPYHAAPPEEDDPLARRALLSPPAASWNARGGRQGFVSASSLRSVRVV